MGIHHRSSKSPLFTTSTLVGLSFELCSELEHSQGLRGGLESSDHEHVDCKRPQIDKQNIRPKCIPWHHADLHEELKSWSDDKSKKNPAKVSISSVLDVHA